MDKGVQELHDHENKVSFDNRICHLADLKDLDFSLIKDFLRAIKSDLLTQADKIPFEHLCRQMQIIQGSHEFIKPLNIGLMMFNNNPEQFFPYARIEVVHFHDEVGDSFSEAIFKGPLHIQLKEALRYLKTMFFKEEVRKRPDRAEADRFYNYPYVALEEALVNAVYHKDYAQREVIEVSIRIDRIEILSFPGPLPPLKVEDLNKGSAHVRTYRNRRIGDFLKELHLTEGRCTGVPKIYKAMQSNGSPPPIFETDDEMHYFLTILPIHPEATPHRANTVSQVFNEERTNSNASGLSNETHQSEHKTHRSNDETHQHAGVFGTKTHQYRRKTHQVVDETHRSNNETHRSAALFEGETIPTDILEIINKPKKRSTKKEDRIIILKLCAWKPLTAQQLVTLLKKKDKRHLVRSYLTPMVNEGSLEYLFPENEKFPGQAYVSRERP